MILLDHLDTEELLLLLPLLLDATKSAMKVCIKDSALARPVQSFIAERDLRS
jgi:hypothetical protein